MNVAEASVIKEVLWGGGWSFKQTGEVRSLAEIGQNKKKPLCSLVFWRGSVWSQFLVCGMALVLFSQFLGILTISDWAVGVSGIWQRWKTLPDTEGATLWT